MISFLNLGCFFFHFNSIFYSLVVFTVIRATKMFLCLSYLSSGNAQEERMLYAFSAFVAGVCKIANGQKEFVYCRFYVIF